MAIFDPAIEAEYTLHKSWPFRLWPRQWQTYELVHEWEKERLENQAEENIPVTSGIYTLIVCPGIAGHTDCSYLMYVGKSGSLRTRFNDYLGRERDPARRTRMSRFLNIYSDYLFFCYTQIPENNLDATEAGIRDAYIPPINIVFKGIVQACVQAWG